MEGLGYGLTDDDADGAIIIKREEHLGFGIVMMTTTKMTTTTNTTTTTTTTTNHGPPSSQSRLSHNFECSGQHAIAWLGGHLIPVVMVVVVVVRGRRRG